MYKEYKIVTTAEDYTDIDALACAVAYKELLELEGRDAEVVFPGPLNHTVSPMVYAQGFVVLTEPSGEVDDVVIVDISNPDAFAKFVTLDSVTELYDHHTGFEEFWEEKLGAAAHIEPVGACATLIWETWNERGFVKQISTTSANLLTMGIISNTLDCKSPVTVARDRDALAELAPYTDLPEGWKTTYYQEQEEVIFADVVSAIVNDTKSQYHEPFGGDTVIGQMELWDGGGFLEKHQADIHAAMDHFGADRWLMNVPSISENKTYIYATHETVQEVLQKAIDCVFADTVAVLNKLVLRKEIVKAVYAL